MECALSGVEPVFPVVSRNGQVFEKALIEKHLSQNPTCPITGEPMSVDELIPLKSNKISKPRVASATSIPSLLQIFQNEWDSTVLECFTLKKQLDATRQELAHALYQHDAACRVIARLIKERDEARAQLEKIKLSNQSQSKDSEGMEVEVQGFSEEFKEKITKVSLELSGARTTRDTTALSIDSIQEFKELSSNPVHSSSSPGILSVDIFNKNNNLILTGGGDNNAVLFDKNAKKKLATLSSHTKPVTAVKFFMTEDVLFTGSRDNTVNIWKSPENAHNYSVEHQISSHKGGVTTIDLHPLFYLLTSSLDGHWGFHDIQTGSTIGNVKHPLNSPILASNIHPDCLLYLTGLENGKISIWDIRNQNTIQTLDAHKGGVTSLKCSENGYYMVSSGETEVSLWDLRKCAVLRKSEFDNKRTSPISSVDIVHSGKYTAISGPDVKILLTNSLEEIHTLSTHTDNVTSVKWSRDGSFLASTSLDRSMKLYGL